MTGLSGYGKDKHLHLKIVISPRTNKKHNFQVCTIYGQFSPATTFFAAAQENKDFGALRRVPTMLKSINCLFIPKIQVWTHQEKAPLML